MDIKNRLIWIYLQKEFNNDNQNAFFQKRNRLLRDDYCIDNLQSQMLQCFLTDGSEAFIQACYKMRADMQKAIWLAIQDLEKQEKKKRKSLITQGTETN